MCRDQRHPNIQLIDGAVVISGKRHNLPVTKEYTRSKMTSSVEWEHYQGISTTSN